MDTSRDIALERQIDAYIKGQLNEQQAEKLWVELFTKPEYIDLLETEIHVKAIIESESSRSQGDNLSFIPSIGREWKKSAKWMAAAATVAILVISIFLLKTTTRSLRDLALSNINVVENLSTPDVVRAQKAPLSSTDSLLNLGFKAAISGNADKALEMYNKIILSYADDPAVSQAYLNVGIIQYNAGHFDKATKAFNNALQTVDHDPLLQEKAYWYMGNAYIHLEELKQARKSIKNAFSMDGIYHKPAQRLLQKLDYKLGISNPDEQPDNK